MSNQKRLSNLTPKQLELLRKKLAMKQASGSQPKERITKGETMDDYPLSSAQRRLWFLQQMEPDSAFYNIPSALRLSGPLQVDVLEESLNQVIQRHEILRSYFFADKNGEPRQKVVPSLRLNLDVYDLSQKDIENLEKRVDDILKDEATKTFDLKSAPLMKATVIKEKTNAYILLMNFHHIIADGWSLGVFIREFVLIYRFLSEKSKPQLSPPALQFSDYAQWQNEHASKQVIEKQLDFWRGYLKGMPSTLELFTDFPRPAIQMHRGKQLIFDLGKELSADLRKLGRDLNVTPFALMMAAVQVFLHKISGQEDFGIGAPIANRNRREVEDIIGFFVNTIVLRANMEPGLAFEQLAKKVQKDILNASDNQDVPFDQIVDELISKPDLSRSPLFQVMFDLQKVPFVRHQVGDIELSLMDVEINISKFDLLFLMTDYPDTIRVTLEYNTDLFKTETIDYYTKYLKILLKHITYSPGASLSELSMCFEKGKEFYGLEDQSFRTPATMNSSVLSLFNEQVGNSPESAALYYNGKITSYRKLNDQANQLAHYLVKRQLNNRRLIALFMDRSPEVIISILAILKAGSAYLPLDPNFPRERLAFILEDTKTNTLISTSQMKEQLPVGIPNLILLDEEWPDISKNSAPSIDPLLTSNDLLYVMYTSGSTGKPKGVSISHRGVVRLVKNAKFANLDSKENFLQLAPVSFDASTLEIWGALLNGAQLTIMPPGAPSFRDIADILIKQKISFLWLTAGLFHLMVDEQLQALCTVKQVLSGGDVLSVTHVLKFLENKSPGTVLVNAYGPTENTTFTSCYPMKDASGITTSVPIGQPINNTQIYILDTHFQPVPAGIPGEMFIGGAGLAHDYINRPDLTAEKFLPNPFIKKAGERMYQTGDLVRKRFDGNIEFLGRIDTQVKIRGFRIELGEIEAQLKTYPSIKDALVSTFETRPGDKALVAYIILKDGQKADAQELKHFLDKKIPAYMVPTYFMFMDIFPLKNNGKIDIKLLPLPGNIQVNRKGQFVLPRNKLEAHLAQLWKEILHIKKISVYDNFFDLGGNSLKAAVLVNRLQDETNKQLHVGIIFQAPRIAELAMYAQEYFSEEIINRFGESDSAQYDYNISPTHEEKLVEEKTLKNFRSIIPPLPRRTISVPSKKNPHAIFLLSPPRSGSTLLRVMLAGNDKLFSPPELDLLSFNTLGERKKFFIESKMPLWLEAPIRAIKEIKQCTNDEATKIMESFEARDMPIKEFYLTMQNWLPGKRIIDKTPSYALDPATLQRAEEDFDQPLYIHLVRHPYAMIYSFIEAKLDKNFFKYPHDFSRQEMAELIWIVSHQNIKGFLAEVPLERQIQIRFEDLLLRPESEARRLSSFLGVEYKTDMIKPYQGNKMTDGIGATSQMVGDFKFYLHSDIDQNVAERWRKFHKTDFLSDIAWDLADGFGYTVEKDSASEPHPLSIEMPSIEPRPRNLPSPLSFAQQRLWFIDQLEPDNPQYNIPGAIRIKGPIQRSILEKAIRFIIERHEILRTTFHTVDGRAIQNIHDIMPFSLAYKDLSYASNDVKEQMAQKLISKLSRKTLNLSVGPLLHAQLIQLSTDESIFGIVLHHIITDGWSNIIFVRELSAAYDAFLTNQKPNLPALKIQYADYAYWQRQLFDDAFLQNQLDFWKSYLKNSPPLLDLPTDFPRTGQQALGKRYYFNFGVELSAKIRSCCKSGGKTTFMFLMSAFQVLLHHYSRQKDILVGITTANRSSKELEHLIGFFVNTLVIRNQMSEDDTFSDILRKNQEYSGLVLNNQDVPFEKIIDALEVERNLEYSPIFQVMFSFQSKEMQKVPSTSLNIKPYRTDSGTAKFDILLEMYDTETLQGAIEYNARLFREESIEKMLDGLRTICNYAVDHPNYNLRDFTLLTKDEQKKVLYTWNDTAKDYGPPIWAALMVQRQAEKKPHAPALAFDGTNITYEHFCKKVNRLAHLLVEKGVRPDTLVGVCMDRSVEMVVALHAIVAAGGAYVPFDPAHPLDRTRFMVKDSAIKMMLTQEGLAEKFNGFGIKTVVCQNDDEWLKTYPETLPKVDLHPDNLAYMIYTSGSTGKPKGALLTHGGLLNRILWMQDAYKLSSSDKVLQKTPYSFDVSVWEFFWPLMFGAQLIVARPQGHKDTAYLTDLIRKERITTIHFVPPMLQVFLQDTNAAQCISLKRVICSGEALSYDLQEKFYNTYNQARLYNLYGPTEASIDVTSYACPRVEQNNRLVPIGKPIANTQIYILNQALSPVPVGVAGELHIAGKNLARGYADRPALTAEKFIPDPFSEKPGARMYKTGDLCSYLPDGEIKYIGRIDHQVKVRGFRIELGEIEAILNEHPNINACTAMVREMSSREKVIIAYLQADNDEKPGIADLRAHIANTLPDYMIPAHFVYLEKIPLTSNGKVDRKALPLPQDAEKPKLKTAYVAPINQTEKILCTLWADILHVDKVGTHDNFFELGGDSIIGIQLIAAAAREGLLLTPRHLFEYPTVEGLASVASKGVAIKADQTMQKGTFPLLPITHWFIEQGLARTDHWNQSLMLKSERRLDPQILEQIVGHIYLHHDALRLALHDNVLEFTKAEDVIPFEYFDLRNESKNVALRELAKDVRRIQSGHNLEEGKIFFCAYFSMPVGETDRLFISIHHIGVDGLSWRIIMEDIQLLYSQLSNGRDAKLPQKTTSIAYWANALQKYADRDEIRAEQIFWKNQLTHDFARIKPDVVLGKADEASLKKERLTFDNTFTLQLFQDVLQAYNMHIDEMLLSALLQMLYRESGTKAMLVDMEGHGRETVLPEVDLSRTIGWFTSIYPVALIPHDVDDPGILLREVKEQFRSIPQNGFGYGLLRYISTDASVRQAMAELPQAEILFNYLGRFENNSATNGFAPAPDETGDDHGLENNRKYLLEITASVINGELQLDFNYSANRFNPDSIRRLAAYFKEGLKSLSAHCLQVEDGGYTPSDFSAAGVGQDELDDILSELDDLE